MMMALLLQQVTTMATSRRPSCGPPRPPRRLSSRQSGGPSNGSSCASGSRLKPPSPQLGRRLGVPALHPPPAASRHSCHGGGAPCRGSGVNSWRGSPPRNRRREAAASPRVAANRPQLRPRAVNRIKTFATAPAGSRCSLRDSRPSQSTRPRPAQRWTSWRGENP